MTQTDADLEQTYIEKLWFPYYSVVFIALPPLCPLLALTLLTPEVLKNRDESKLSYFRPVHSY